MWFAMGNGHDLELISVGQRSTRALWLGKVDADAAIEIRWPSGIVQTLTHVRVDQEVHVEEPGS